MIKKFMGVFVIVVALTAVMTISASATWVSYQFEDFLFVGDKSFTGVVALWDQQNQPLIAVADYRGNQVVSFSDKAWAADVANNRYVLPAGTKYSSYVFYSGSWIVYDAYEITSEPTYALFSDCTFENANFNVLNSDTGDVYLVASSVYDASNKPFITGLASSSDFYTGDYIRISDLTFSAEALSSTYLIYPYTTYYSQGGFLSFEWNGSVFDILFDYNGLGIVSNLGYIDDTGIYLKYLRSMDSIQTYFVLPDEIESPPDQGGGLEPITVFFSSSSLGPESVGLQFDLNGLTSTVNYTWIVTVKDGSGNTVFTNSESITGETTYSGAQFIYDLEPTKTYTADLVVTTAAGQVGSASTSVQTENYAYVIDVDSVSIEGNTAVIDGNIVFPADLPSQYQTVYLVSTLDSGFEAENDRVAVGSPNFQVYFGDPELAYSTEYTCTLELYYAKSDYTLGVPSGITQEVVFTTESNTPVTPDPEPEDPTVGDLIDDLKDWNQVTVIPGTVSDKTQQGDDLRDEFEKLEKPETDGLVPDVEIDVSPVQGFFDILWGSAFFMTMLVTVVGLAFIRYVLFGKV